MRYRLRGLTAINDNAGFRQAAGGIAGQDVDDRPEIGRIVDLPPKVAGEQNRQGSGRYSVGMEHCATAHQHRTGVDLPERIIARAGGTITAMTADFAVVIGGASGMSVRTATLSQRTAFHAIKTRY